MKVLLVQPPLNPTILGPGNFYLSEPLALELLASSIPNHDVRILDMRVNNNLEMELEEFPPDILGITCCTADACLVFKIAYEVKKCDRRILTVVGGCHPTFNPEDFNNTSVDVVVLGEGEQVFKNLVDAVEAGSSLADIRGIVFSSNGNLCFTRPQPLIPHLDEIPFARRDLTEKYRSRYYNGKGDSVACVFTSRGCPFRCIFCSLWKLYRGEYRVRNPELVAEELETINEQYIDIIDDNTFHDIDWAKQLCHIIEESRVSKKYKLWIRPDTVVKAPDLIEMWKDIGLQAVVTGLESHRESDLQLFAKRFSTRTVEQAVAILQKNSVQIMAYFVVNPDYDKADFKALANYVESLDLENPVFTVLTPLPGTDLLEKCHNQLTTRDYARFDLAHPVLPTRLPAQEFMDCFLNLYRRFYSAKGPDREGVFDFIKQADVVRACGSSRVHMA